MLTAQNKKQKEEDAAAAAAEANERVKIEGTKRERKK
jgi:hypothetical protein